MTGSMRGWRKSGADPVGHPLDPKTVIGPLIHRCISPRSGVFRHRRGPKAPRWRAGGEKVGGPGLLRAAHAVHRCRNDMRIAQEEIFGPLLTAIPFKDEAEALAIANDVAYGLAGYVWTNDLTRALRISDAMEAGMIWVNSENVRHLPTPFGGVKASGIGRDGGDWSFDFYMEQKNVAFATACTQRLPAAP
jgi:5-carboxymethyl-2-hydroxymuconic-semialdehyde dehydrogenase